MADERLEKNKAKELDLIHQAGDLGGTSRDIGIAAKRPEPEINAILGREEHIDKVVTNDEGLEDDVEGAGEGLTEFEQAFEFTSSLPKGKSQAEVSTKSVKLGLVQAASTPEANPADFFTNAEDEIRRSETSQGIIDVHLQDIQGNTNRKFQEGMYAAVKGGVPVDTFAGISKELTKAQEDANGLLATEKTIVRAFAAKSLSQSIKDDLSLKNYSASLVEDHFIDSGIGSLATDLGSLIVHPLVNTIEYRDVGIALDPEFSGDPWEAWTNTVVEFNQATSDVKKAMIPKIMHALVKGHNNNQFQVEAGMAMLFNPDFVSDIKFERNMEMSRKSQLPSLLRSAFGLSAEK